MCYVISYSYFFKLNGFKKFIVIYIHDTCLFYFLMQVFHGIYFL
ncbi:hypothetical protein XBFFL1_1640056 [Xenorhabdus bovienii str. feltiae Florida]|nr:hypothetical protein XBFFR1_1990024 [Xenorhabdus bovienii str. feltiae France]CDG91544.1 hypothetical protein XBFFL1_1640056 [Xenorhabdus bovienii str. feltiae Florida]